MYIRRSHVTRQLVITAYFGIVCNTNVADTVIPLSADDASAHRTVTAKKTTTLLQQTRIANEITVRNTKISVYSLAFMYIPTYIGLYRAIGHNALWIISLSATVSVLIIFYIKVM